MTFKRAADGIAPGLLAERHGLREPFLLEIAHHNAGALTGKLDCGGLPDAARCARDNRHFVFESHAIASLESLRPPPVAATQHFYDCRAPNKIMTRQFQVPQSAVATGI